MKNYNCLYSVLFSDADGNQQTDYGMLFADSFADGVDQLERILYGDDLIGITHMELIENSPVFSKETWERIREELNNS